MQINKDGEFVVLEEVRRSLQSTPPLPHERNLRGNYSIAFTNSSDDHDGDIFKAKECPCAADTFYCLMDGRRNDNLCTILDDRPVCYYSTPYSSIVRNSWPVVVLWYAAVALYLVTTEAGRSAVRYLCSKLFCRGHQYRLNIVDNIMRHEQYQRLREAELARRAMHQQDSVTYILKTKQYCSKVEFPELSPSVSTAPSTPASDSPLINSPDLTKHSVSETEEKLKSSSPSTEDSDVPDTNAVFTYESDDDNEVTCTICMLPIEDGDRIGALECDHKFHVECLKQWIKRRNVCPLCQSPDIAAVKRSEAEAEDADEEMTRPHQRPALARLRRLRALRREAVRTRLFPANMGGRTRVPNAVPEVMLMTNTNEFVRRETLVSDGDGGRRIVRISTRRSVRQTNQNNRRHQLRQQQGILTE